MSVPPASDKVWMDIVTGRTQYDFDFLAAKMVVGRLRTVIQQDPSTGTVQRCAEELRDVFAKNVNLSKVQKDLEKIFGQGDLR